VEEFESPLIEEMKGQVAAQHRFQVTGTHIDLRGYCRRCSQSLTK
jgi:Fe2+ or Zn2+ uptake regulation protein